ncbi:MAG: hypothetical protein HZC54_04330 [Verrucomicrobia bacterium]|nr:hypothetical protein [Verrucomicrobiota bacterium]
MSFRNSPFFTLNFSLLTSVSRTLLLLAMVALWTGCSRNAEFRAQAEVGQPIVTAIEEYHKQTGSYPAALVDLVPKYLPVLSEMTNTWNGRVVQWEYYPAPNAYGVAPYILRFCMGHGGIEYRPPDWIGNDEGTITTLISNRPK